METASEAIMAAFSLWVGSFSRSSPVSNFFFYFIKEFTIILMDDGFRRASSMLDFFRNLMSVFNILSAGVLSIRFSLHFSAFAVY